MDKIAFFGAGLMGTGFVRRARANGVEVNVWNRSPAKAQALQASGARAFDDAAAALAGVQRIHLSLADDASVDAVLEPLADKIGADTWIVDHTTTAVQPTAERAARWAARGRVFVHAPVFMGPANAADGSGLMLVSGPRAQHDALLPVLQRMTGTVHYVGEAAQRAAAFKLFGNLTLLGLLGLLGDVNRLAHAVGIDTRDAFSLFEHFNPGATLPARLKRIGGIRRARRGGCGAHAALSRARRHRQPRVNRPSSSPSPPRPPSGIWPPGVRRSTACGSSCDSCAPRSPVDSPMRSAICDI